MDYYYFDKMAKKRPHNIKKDIVRLKIILIY